MLLENQGYERENVISMGDILRRHKEENHVIAECLHRGVLVPDRIVNQCFIKELKSIKTSAEVVILDGAIRTWPQAKSAIENLSQRFGDLGGKIATVRVVIDQDLGMKRALERGRFDDNPENIRERWLEYNKNEKSVLTILRKKGRLYEVENNSTKSALAYQVAKVISLERMVLKPHSLVSQLRSQASS